jgi:cytochrome d ubiquinol oxidase subunit II
MATACYLLAAVLFAAWAVLDGFDLGTGVVFLFLRGSARKLAALRAIGPVWNGNEVWLVAAVGCLLAAFPPVYGALLSGLYVPVVLFLLGVVARAAALDFRGRTTGPFGRAACDLAFTLGSFLVAFLTGFAAASVARGLPIDASGEVRKVSLRLVSAPSLAAGALSTIIVALQGLAWLRLKAPPQPAAPRAGAVLFIGASALPVAGIGILALRSYPALVPSTIDLQWSLTIGNAAAGDRSLVLLLVFAAVGVPVVALINIVLYRTFRGRSTREPGST